MINYGKGLSPVSKALRAANVSSALARGRRAGLEAHGQGLVHLRSMLYMAACVHTASML